ncbi:hypothetical protein [uncultured Shewanella sp.]|uniref:hypothetical protein n=1 Tax=uncultured Shewanella sp. TaxID=173975 RepID=UPI0026061CD3|nr:hypothetical protein [uncultured Shewanella sp.]
MEQSRFSVSKPSEFYQAIKQALQAQLADWKAQGIVEEVLVQSYQGAERQAQIYSTLSLAAIFIEFEWQVEQASSGQGLYGHGLYGHSYHIKLHCAVPQTAADNITPSTTAALMNLNLLAALTRFVDDNTWGINPLQIDKPKYLNTSGCGFYAIDQEQSHHEHVNADISALGTHEESTHQDTTHEDVIVRVLSWRQTLYLGEQEQAEEARAGMRVAANPVNIDVTDEYRTILVTPRSPETPKPEVPE